ncbi:MAG: hypothetical protein ACRC9L_02285 [Brevinema sp.]
MSRTCTALILSKKGFGEGNLLLNVLDEEYGRISLAAYGGALETGSRRAALLSGNLINGLVQSTPQGERISESVVLSSYDNIRSELKPMGFFLFTLEILDMILPIQLPLENFSNLLKALSLFDASIDEKFVLFYITGLLYQEGWMEIPEKERLSTPALRFCRDAGLNSPEFLSGKHISASRKHEIVYFITHMIKKAIGKTPKSLELLRFE